MTFCSTVIEKVVCGTNKEFESPKSFTHTRANAFKIGLAPDIPDGLTRILTLTVVMQSQCSSPVQAK